MPRTTLSDSAREARARRLAGRLGLTVRTSHTRIPQAADFGCFFLVDPATNGFVAGDRYGLSLDQLEAAVERA